MKTIYFQTIIILLLFAAACNNPRTNDKAPPAAAFATDTLFTPTGNAKLDSLLQLTASAPQDTTLAKLYYQIAQMYKENDFEKAIDYFLKLNDLSVQLGWSLGQYWFASGFSIILVRQQLSDSAIAVNRRAYALAAKEKNEKWMALIDISTGTAYRSKEWNETALEYYTKALSYFEPRKESHAGTLGKIYDNMC